MKIPPNAKKSPWNESPCNDTSAPPWTHETPASAKLSHILFWGYGPNTIVPRGIAALGYTIQLPTEDRYLVTKKELEEKLASLLGGRVAEEFFFNDVSTGRAE